MIDNKNKRVYDEENGELVVQNGEISRGHLKDEWKPREGAANESEGSGQTKREYRDSISLVSSHGVSFLSLDNIKFKR